MGLQENEEDFIRERESERVTNIQYFSKMQNYWTDPN